MGKPDDRVPTDPGSLLRRMIALARLGETLGHNDSRRAALDRILDHMMLFSRMTDRLGIARPQSPLMLAVLREAELGCMQCADWRRCRRWLDGRSPEDDYREFCPNEGLFGVMPRQDNILRPYGIDK